MTTLTVLVPAFNEEATIRDVLTAISLEKIPGVQLEVVVVDDASTDGTGAVLKDCASIYDKLTFRIKEDEDGQFWVYAEKTELEPGSVESLSDLEG